jgi:hypothetical protein
MPSWSSLAWQATLATSPRSPPPASAPRRRSGALAALLIVTGTLLFGAMAAFWINPDWPYELFGQQAPACHNPDGDDPFKEDLGDAYRMTYRWHYKGEDWRFSIEVPKQTYESFRNEDEPTRIVQFPDGPYNQPAYDEYVSHPGDDVALSEIAGELARVADAEGWGRTDRLSFALAFVQCLPYAADDVTQGFDDPNYPLETLVDGEGDCEDTSILYASLLRALDEDVVLLSPPKHMGVGIASAPDAAGSGFEFEGQRYLYAETTGDGFRIGEMPAEYRGEDVQVFTLEDE